MPKRVIAATATAAALLMAGCGQSQVAKPKYEPCVEMPKTCEKVGSASAEEYEKAAKHYNEMTPEEYERTRTAKH